MICELLVRFVMLILILFVMLVKVILLFLLMKVLFLLLLDDIINGVVIKGERILLKEYKKCRVLNKLGFFDF